MAHANKGFALLGQGITFLAIPIHVLEVMGSSLTKDAVALALSLDPNTPLTGIQASSIEMVMNNQHSAPLQRVQVAEGVAWTNVPEGALSKKYLFNQVKVTPSVAIIKGCWPLPLDRTGRFAKYLWTFDWPKVVNKTSAEELMEQFSESAVMYNLIE